MARLPDFVIIGAMKAGTTTLFNRLGEVPGVSLPRVKEPHFFSKDRQWARGLGWYESIFEGCEGVTGEASASYSDAATVEIVVERMWDVIPRGRLLFSLRHPVERMRSHYRHEVLRARESRPFQAAISDTSSGYLTRSLYGEVLEAYLNKFPERQILLLRLEDLDAASGAWERILTHLGLAYTPMRSLRHNRSAQKRQFTPALLWLWERNLIPSKRVPARIRRAGKSILTRDASSRSELLEGAGVPVDAEVLDAIRSDQTLLRGLVTDPSLVLHDL